MSWSLHDKATFYNQLHTAVHAGLPLQRFLASGVLPARRKLKNPDTEAGIASGSSLATTLGKTGLFSGWELRLLAAGEQIGALETLAENLGDYFTGRYSQYREIRSRLLYPFIVLVAAIIIPPLPAIARGELAVNSWLFDSALKILVLYLVYEGLFRRPYLRFGSGGFNPLILASLDYVRLNSVFRRIYEAAWTDMLTLCLKCGMDAAGSLRVIGELLPGSALKTRHRQASRDVEKNGHSLVRAVFDNLLLQLPIHKAFMYTSEQSGTLHNDLRFYALRCRQEVSLDVRHLVRQASWILYTLALLLAAAGIL